MTDPNIEKRKEPRRVGKGAVRVQWESPKRYEVEGHLKDFSPSGFRMTHDASNLTAGQVVEFTHFAGKGRARVVWTRITTAFVESGFLVES